MDSDSPPKKMSGYFQAFKTSVAKTKPAPNIDNFNILDRGVRALIDRAELSRRLELIFQSIDGAMRHLNEFSNRIANLATRTILVSEKLFNETVNSYLTFELINLRGSLKLTEASDAISIFKKLKQITSTIIFITTRNFSIQKDLSISA